MPSYEIALILRKLPRPGTAAALKRTATKIFDTNGILFGIENLGTRTLPYRIRNHGQWNSEGSYFVLKFDLPSRTVNELLDEYHRDGEIVRFGITKLSPPESFECTLEEELKPAPYRKDVQEMLEKGKKKEKKFEYKSGLTYSPLRM